jgi:protein involved in polysaccharide export with SLBB domain
MVAITGSVNTPAIIELKGNEKLSDLLNLAGGFTNVASGQKVTLERIHERKIRKVAEFNLDKEGLAKSMQDGDLVNVFTISERFDNAVKLQGNVAAPMRYVWKEGMRITDLLSDKNAIITSAYWARQNSGALNNNYNQKQVNWDYALLQRLDNEKLTTKQYAFNLGKAIKGDPVENMLLEPGDIVTTFSADEALPKTENEIVLKGSIFSPSNRRFVWRSGMKIKDVIPNAKELIDYYDYWLNSQGKKLSVGINWGYANIVRLQPSNLTRSLIPFDLGKLLLENNDSMNLALNPGDEITIYTNEDIQVPMANKTNYVRLEC